MGNYLNPSILVNGIDDIIGRYMGWILVGCPSKYDSTTSSWKTDTTSSTTNGSMPTSDGNIAGIMEPVKVTASSVKSNALTFGNIGYFVAPVDVPTAPVIANKDSAEVTKNNDDASNIYNIAVNTYTTGNTCLFVKNISGQSTIFPTKVTQALKDSHYIDIGSGNGKILLILWKEGLSYSKEDFANDLQAQWTNTEETYIPPTKTSQVIEKYIDKVLFAYDVSASEQKCNDWNYTGFSVGDIEVALTGLSS